MDNDLFKIKRLLEIFCSNGLHEKIIIPCVLRNEVIKQALENEIRALLSKLKYFPKDISLSIESLKTHETQVVPPIIIAQMSYDGPPLSYNIIPDFLLKIEFKDADTVVYLPAEIETQLSSHLYWQSFLYSTFIVCILQPLKFNRDYILKPPFFVLFLADNPSIRNKVSKRFGGNFINLYDLELKIPNSDIYLCKQFLDNKLIINKSKKIYNIIHI
ncbi:MAG: hypothetical protein ACTSPQ_15280 [Candidatus Helarchaeota archaeon]